MSCPAPAALGFDEAWARELERVQPEKGTALQAGRVLTEHRGALELAVAGELVWANLRGRLRHRAGTRLELPAVGDWVATTDGRVEAVLPRRSVLVRKAAGQRNQPQVIAANLDTVFVVTSQNQEFNPRRIERYLHAVLQGGAAPVLVLSKCDLEQTVGPAQLNLLQGHYENLPVVRVSVSPEGGFSALRPWLGEGRTVAVVGSSGVGKSTLVNSLLGVATQEVFAIREHDAHGRHTTTRRQLCVLPAGAALVDTPGMREFGLWAEGGTEQAPGEALSEGLSGFSDVEALVGACRFSDCAHEKEPGCAVRQAMESGTLPEDRWRQYSKLQKELERAADVQKHARQRREWTTAIARANRARRRLNHD